MKNDFTSPQDALVAWSLKQFDNPMAAGTHRHRWNLRRELQQLRQRIDHKRCQQSSGELFSEVHSISSSRYRHRYPDHVSVISAENKMGSEVSVSSLPELYDKEEGLENEWLQAVYDADKVRVSQGGNAFLGSDPKATLIDAWAAADDRVLQHEDWRAQHARECEAAQDLQEDWPANMKRWELCLAAEDAREEHDRFKKQLEELRNNKTLSEGTKCSQKKPLQESLDASGKKLSTRDKAWETAAQEYLSNANKKAKSLEDLKDSDRYVACRLKQWQKECGLKEDYFSNANAAQVDYLVDLENRLTRAIEEANKSHNIDIYHQRVRQEILEAAGKKIPGAETAWHNRIRKSKAAAANKPNDSFLTAIAAADAEAFTRLRKENARLDRIETLWNILQREREKAKQRLIEQAAWQYHNGSTASWKGLSQADRETYNDLISQENNNDAMEYDAVEESRTQKLQQLEEEEVALQSINKPWIEKLKQRFSFGLSLKQAQPKRTQEDIAVDKKHYTELLKQYHRDQECRTKALHWAAWKDCSPQARLQVAKIYERFLNSANATLLISLEQFPAYQIARKVAHLERKFMDYQRTASKVFLHHKQRLNLEELARHQHSAAQTYSKVLETEADGKNQWTEGWHNVANLYEQAASSCEALLALPKEKKYVPPPWPETISIGADVTVMDQCITLQSTACQKNGLMIQHESHLKNLSIYQHSAAQAYSKALEAEVAGDLQKAEACRHSARLCEEAIKNGQEAVAAFQEKKIELASHLEKLSEYYHNTAKVHDKVIEVETNQVEEWRRIASFYEQAINNRKTALAAFRENKKDLTRYFKNISNYQSNTAYAYEQATIDELEARVQRSRAENDRQQISGSGFTADILAYEAKLGIMMPYVSPILRDSLNKAETNIAKASQQYARAQEWKEIAHLYEEAVKYTEATLNAFKNNQPTLVYLEDLAICHGNAAFAHQQELEAEVTGKNQGHLWRQVRGFYFQSIDNGRNAMIAFNAGKKELASHLEQLSRYQNNAGMACRKAIQAEANVAALSEEERSSSLRSFNNPILIAEERRSLLLLYKEAIRNREAALTAFKQGQKELTSYLKKLSECQNDLAMVESKICDARVAGKMRMTEVWPMTASIYKQATSSCADALTAFTENKKELALTLANLSDYQHRTAQDCSRYQGNADWTDAKVIMAEIEEKTQEAHAWRSAGRHIYAAIDSRISAIDVYKNDQQLALHLEKLANYQHSAGKTHGEALETKAANKLQAAAVWHAVALLYEQAENYRQAAIDAYNKNEKENAFQLSDSSEFSSDAAQAFSSYQNDINYAYNKALEATTSKKPAVANACRLAAHLITQAVNNCETFLAADKKNKKTLAVHLNKLSQLQDTAGMVYNKAIDAKVAGDTNNGFGYYWLECERNLKEISGVMTTIAEDYQTNLVAASENEKEWWRTEMEKFAAQKREVERLMDEMRKMGAGS